MRALVQDGTNDVLAVVDDHGNIMPMFAGTNVAGLLADDQARWVDVIAELPADYLRQHHNLLGTSVRYDYEPDRGLVVQRFPDANFSPTAVRKALHDAVRISARHELARTDWYFTRMHESGTTVPVEVRQERAAIRNKVDELDAQIDSCPEADLLDFTFSFGGTRPGNPAPVARQVVPGGDGQPWVTDANAPGQRGNPIRPAGPADVVQGSF